MELEVYLFIAKLNMMNDLIWIMISLVLVGQSCRKDHRSNEFIIHEIDLIPEGIAYSANRNTFFLTSIAKGKIITINAHTGIQNDFIDEKEYDYMPGVGIVVDDDRELIHALGGFYMNEEKMIQLHPFILSI